MIDHLALNVSDLEASRAFYTRALEPLGIGVVLERPGSCGLGEEGKPYFFIHARGEPSTSVHVAFTAADRPAVDAFHRAALEAGGTDNGGPGVREQYHPTYYGAFVLDPDGNNIEAVCHTPEQ